MRTVELSTHAVGTPWKTVFAAIANTARYGDHTDTVIDVTVDQLENGRSRSAWTVRFRQGILKYVSEEVADPDTGEIRFRAVDGDLEHFDGVWRVGENPDGTSIDLRATFDTGLGSLTDIVDPIAEQTLRENFQLILEGLIGQKLDVTR